MLCCCTAFARSGTRETEFGQHVRLDPDAHGVVAGAEQPHLADARHAVEDVVDVDVGVVGEEERVVGPVRRVERDDQHRQAGGLAQSSARTG